MDRKMNILVLGVSGAGKSTLIEAISGQKITSGVGEGQTQKIDIYESDNWNFRLIDTKGFEYNIFEQMKTINQVKKFTKEQLQKDSESGDSEDDNPGLDAVWYCVSGVERRTFLHNINLMNRAIKGWKNIPVFAVITKSYSETELPENIEAVKIAFAKTKSTNLKNVIPVVAKEFPINSEVTVAPMGISELCLSTLDHLDEAKKINDENRYRMILEQKRFTANALTTGATASAVAVAIVPLNFADSALLIPLETVLVKGIFKVYGVEVNGELISALVGSAAITSVAKTIVKAIPIAGDVVNAIVAGVIVFALGESIIAAAEGIYTGKLDIEKINDIVEFVNEKIKTNPVAGAVITYITNNADKLKDKKPIEIVNEIIKLSKKKSIKKN